MMVIVSAKTWNVANPVDNPMIESPATSPKSCATSLFRCSYPECDAAFSKPCRLEWHLRVHNGLRPYKCEFSGCSKSYTRSYHLNRHQVKRHGPKSALSSAKYVCSFENCGKSLSSKQLLNRHIKGYHHVRPYSCEVCHKRFLKHCHLTTHEFEHTKQHPYRCEVEGCGKGFFRRLKLLRHAKIHEGYKCPEEGCIEKFEKWSQLRAHKAARHRKLFQCELCKKSFVRKGFLVDHMAIHNSQRECVECPLCNSILVSTKSLKDHSTRCSANKPKLICDFAGCEKIFLRKSNFDKHKALHPKADSIS